MFYKPAIQSIDSADSGPCITWWLLTVTLLCVVDSAINSDLSPSFIAANQLSHFTSHKMIWNVQLQRTLNDVSMPGSGVLPSLCNTAVGLLQFKGTQVIPTCPFAQTPCQDSNSGLGCQHVLCISRWQIITVAPLWLGLVFALMTQWVPFYTRCCSKAANSH